MWEAFSIKTILLGVLIFCARVVDVGIGTIRTISIVQGRTKAAFLLGFVEVLIWLFVISTVVDKVMQAPILAVFYAAGFSTGGVVGILVERRIASGIVLLRVICSKNGQEVADKIREMGYKVTIFHGEGTHGRILEIDTVLPRRVLHDVLGTVRQMEPDSYYITEQAGVTAKLLRPSAIPPSGWRARRKKK